MRKLAIFILLLVSILSQAQEERFYNLYEGWKSTAVSEEDSVYQLWGLDTHTTGTYKLIKQSINKDGDFLSVDNSYYIEPYQATTISGNTNFVTECQNSEYIAAYVKYDENRFYPLFMKYSKSSSDTVFSCLYPDLITDRQILFFSSQNHDNFIYVMGRAFDYSEKFRLSFHKIDTLGNVVYSRQYEPTSDDQWADVRKPLQILPTEDGGFILTFEETFVYIGYIPNNQDAYCLKVDSLGNELWRRSLGHHDTINYRPFVFPKPDGSFYVTYSDPYIENYINPGAGAMVNEEKTIWLCEMSSTGFITSRHNLKADLDSSMQGKYLVNDVYQDEFGNMYLAGQMVYYDEKGFLIKISAQGQALWIQHYDCFPDDEYMGGDGMKFTRIYGLTPTSDGGFIMAGEYYTTSSQLYPDGTQSSLVIKVDECGCLEEGCNEDCYTCAPPTQYIRTLPLEITPNPANSYIQISCNAKSGEIFLYNSSGQICINRKYEPNKPLEVSSLEKGVYNIRLNANGKIYFGKFVKN